MRKSFYLMLLVLLVSLFALTACGTSLAGSETTDPVIPEINTDTGWWVDTTSRVSGETMAFLEAESKSIDADGFQMAGVIWNNSVSDESELASDFGNKNGIGSGEKDNGLVVAVFMDKTGSDGNSPVVFIAPGEGLEGLLTDSKIGRFLDTYYVPKRAEGKWEEGLKDTVLAIHRYLREPNADEFRDPPVNLAWEILKIVGLILLIILMVWVKGSSSSSSSGGHHSSGLGGGGGFGGGGSGR